MSDPSTKVIRGGLVTSGKTKELYEAFDAAGCRMSGIGVVHNTDRITAGDGKKRDEIPGKGAWSNTTTCNVYGLLKKCGLRVAWQRWLSVTEFLAELTEQIPLEVIVRRKNFGSNRERHSLIPSLWTFPRLVVQFHLKTKGRQWVGLKSGKVYPFPPDPMKMNGKDQASYDDPLIKFVDETVELYNAHLPLDSQKPFLVLPFEEVFGFGDVMAKVKEMARMSTHAFLILEKSWRLLNFDFLDCKFEFGFYQGQIYISDVLDADSWRPTFHGLHISKEAYRLGAGVDEMAAKFALSANLTGQFMIPEQRLVIWSGSVRDVTQAFEDAFKDYAYYDGKLCPGLSEPLKIALSFHKETHRACMTAQALEFDPVDTAIATNIGRSNGGGPSLAGNTMLPVFSSVPDYKTAPHTAYSSLDTPSDDHLATVVYPGNAILAALNTLALRNPALYAILKMRQEPRFENLVPFS